MFRISLLTVLAMPLTLHAGDGAPWSVGARGYAGFLAPHNKSIWVMVDGHAFAGELHYQRCFSGAKAWHGNYLAPRWGVGVMGLDAGSDLLGPAWRIMPYLELPVVAPGPWEINMRIGWGLGVVRYPFDRVDNSKQHAIGGRLNLAAQIAAGVRRSLGPHGVELSISVDHLSNGAMQQPNLGINVPAISLGYTYRFSDAPPAVYQADTTWRSSPRTVAYAMANMGWNEAYPLQSGRRSVLSVSASGYRRVTAKSAIGAGLDIFNKGTVAVMDTALAGDPRITYTQFGVHAGYALLFGDMALYIETGAYLHTPVTERADVYTRVGMRQQLTRRLFANLSLKSHFFVADHVEIGLGYRFR